MAYKSFNQRFPSFKWVLLFAVLISLPLTVFSVQKVSTNTQQHAAIYLPAPLGLSTQVYCAFKGKDNSGARFKFSWLAVPKATFYRINHNAADNSQVGATATTALSLTINPTTSPGSYWKWFVQAYYGEQLGAKSKIITTPRVPNCITSCIAKGSGACKQ